MHNADGSTRIDESGLYIYPQDRRFGIAKGKLVIKCLVFDINKLNSIFILDNIAAIGEAHQVSDFCDEEMFCGMPLYNHRWNKARQYSMWIETSESPEIPTEYPMLVLQDSSELETSAQRRFNFTLAGPSHMGIFINVKNDARILNWSFNDTLIREQAEPPYMVYFSYGLDDSPLEFTIDVEVSVLTSSKYLRNKKLNDYLQKTTSTFDTPTLEIGIGGHWVTQDITAIEKLSSYINRFPSYAYIQGWVGTYETWYF